MTHPLHFPTATLFAAGNATLYGYAGEVVLICLTVLFLLMFVVTAVKYHRLKTRCAAE